MVPALSKNQRSTRRRARSSDPLLSRALGKSLRPMAGEHSRLVHQPAGVVGTSHPGLVPEAKIRNPKSEIRNLCWRRAAARSRELGPRSRYARYMVFIVAMGL